MKHLFKAFVLAMILTLFVRNMVYADDYVSNAVNALKDSKVYVAPGIPGTDFDTAGLLQKSLYSDDNILLVMLPMEAGTGTDLYTIAKSLSDQLGNQYIIGLSVGRNVIGYAPSLPSGIAADKMDRADSVSNDPVTALITFTQNIHKWQASNEPTPTVKPKPTATPEPLPSKDEKAPWLLWVLIPGGIIAVVVVAGIVLVNGSSSAAGKRLRVLAQTESILNDFENTMIKVQDNRVRGELEKALLVAQGLLEILQRASTPQGYMEEKFPTSVNNMLNLTKSYIGHESGKFPLPPENLKQVRDILMNYDEYFAKLQQGNQEAVELMTAVINQQNAMIDTLGYLSQDK